MKNLASILVPGLSDNIFTRLEEIASMEMPLDVNQCREVINSFQQHLEITQTEAAVILLAAIAAQSDAPFTETLVETVLVNVKAEGVVEMLVWLSVIQMLHRMSSYFTLLKANESN